MENKLRYCISEGFAIIFYWANPKHNEPNAKPYAAKIFYADSLTPFVKMLPPRKMLFDGVTYNTDTNFFLDYGILVKDQEEALVKGAEFHAKLKAIAQEFWANEMPQMAGII